MGVPDSASPRTCVTHPRVCSVAAKRRLDHVFCVDALPVELAVLCAIIRKVLEDTGGAELVVRYLQPVEFCEGAHVALVG
eukprot:9042263-Alexandrium_andersonii.AAC.1